MQRKLTTAILFFFLLCNCCISSFAQISAPKTITITVINQKTGGYVSEAEVILRKVMFGPKIQTTGTDGRAVFEVTATPSLSSGRIITVEVKPSFLGGLRSNTATIAISAEKNSYELKVFLLAEDLLFKVLVIEDEEPHKPISGANVNLKNAVSGKTGVSNTDENGNATLDVDLLDSKTVTLLVSKNGYKPHESKVTLVRNYEDDNSSVIVSLIKEEGLQNLEVKVVDENGNPIVDANVTARLSFAEMSNAATNQSGIANLAIKESGNYEVKVTHSQFKEPDSKDINIRKYENKKNQLDFAMIRKKTDNKIDLIVYAYNQDDGRWKAVPNTMISLGNLSARTDEDGKAIFKWAVLAGEEYTISASADKFEAAAITFTVGDLKRYNASDFETQIILKKKATEKLQFVAQVLDHTTNKPIHLAKVVIKSYSGNAVSETLQTNINGEVSLYVDNKALTNGQFRLIASAYDYAEKWSDIPAELLSSNTGKRYLQIYLNPQKKLPGNEIKYGPFTVTPLDWISTNLILPKGGSFRVEATGEYTSVSDKNFHSGPAGGGWGWWSLVGKIGEQRFALGSNGSGTTINGGLLELGTPRVMNFYDVDKADLRGTFIVYVFARDAVQTQ